MFHEPIVLPKETSEAANDKPHCLVFAMDKADGGDYSSIFFMVFDPVTGGNPEWLHANSARYTWGHE